jgi:hypothetical protein
VLKLASVALAALLVLSPALAKNTTIAPAVKQTCTSSDELVAKLKLPVLIKLDGDKLAAFKAAYPQIPEVVDDMIILGAKDAKVFIGLGFVKGCVICYGPIAPRVALPLADVQVEDGSI